MFRPAVPGGQQLFAPTEEVLRKYCGTRKYCVQTTLFDLEISFPMLIKCLAKLLNVYLTSPSVGSPPSGVGAASKNNPTDTSLNQDHQSVALKTEMRHELGGSEESRRGARLCWAGVASGCIIQPDNPVLSWTYPTYLRTKKSHDIGGFGLVPSLAPLLEASYTKPPARASANLDDQYQLPRSLRSA